MITKQTLKGSEKSFGAANVNERTRSSRRLDEEGTKYGNFQHRPQQLYPGTVPAPIARLTNSAKRRYAAKQYGRYRYGAGGSG
jgi:hypothetical protein